jgi:hypothetical protein
MLAEVVEDRRWYFFEIYQKRGTGMNAVLVRVAKKGPLEADLEQANANLREVRKENPGTEVFGYVWMDKFQRWIRWP